MATSVNMCTFRSFASYVSYAINQQTRPLLVNAHRRSIAACVFYKRHCRTVCTESGRNVVRLNLPIGGQTKVLYGYPCSQRLVFAKYMSSEQKPSITEDILKSKLNDTMKTAGSDTNHKQSKTSADKSDSWFGGKNAWKLGLLSLVGMGVLMCGNVLMLWGELNIYILMYHNVTIRVWPIQV